MKQTLLYGEVPIIAGAVKQFWEDVSWGDIDYMFVDCPPGTGDVPLTVLQSLPVAGIVICHFTTRTGFNDCGKSS